MTKWIAMGFLACAVVTSAFVANAPDTFAYLWALKAAGASFTGLSALFLHPPAIGS